MYIYIYTYILTVIASNNKFPVSEDRLLYDRSKSLRMILFNIIRGRQIPLTGSASSADPNRGPALQPLIFNTRRHLLLTSPQNIAVIPVCIYVAMTFIYIQAVVWIHIYKHIYILVYIYIYRYRYIYMYIYTYLIVRNCFH
jgi:hypothetical protein